MKKHFVAFALVTVCSVSVSVFGQDATSTATDTTATTDFSEEFDGLNDFFEEDASAEATDTATTGGENTETPATEAPANLPDQSSGGGSTEGTQITSDTHSSAGTIGTLPSGAEVALSVVNMSRDNADATASGARPGDSLRYEFTLISDTVDILDYTVKFDFSEALSAIEFTNAGLAVVGKDGIVSFPSYSQKAPCEKSFVVMVRVKSDCGNLKSLKVSSENEDSTVPLTCDLSRTGPEQNKFLFLGFLVLLLSTVFGMMFKRRGV